jgi:hypothetical protein
MRKFFLEEGEIDLFPVYDMYTGKIESYSPVPGVWVRGMSEIRHIPKGKVAYNVGGVHPANVVVNLFDPYNGLKEVLITQSLKTEEDWVKVG